ncbi:alpha beta-hydrolase [Coniophora puteana RWD-64-598 SS2]|uniref:Dipeptidyl-peptidase V n=1 Tax=Coniophora puteana (strain RWD-64-598) TaxID=741705 RepID=A0A5M3MKQ0_CONPW|nr:alpha beta-hydrolase [Coniophora puteana RWD-64-598 SS2]EIW79550.1 alpha beta-hydrolase [Coniophora puteana RWD-64-598 SS2]
MAAEDDMTDPILQKDLKFSHPASQIKAVNVDAPPQRIYDDMKKYEDAARGYSFFGFERTVKDKHGTEVPGGVFVKHRPVDAQVDQVYRMSTDPERTDLERLTHFETRAGRNIALFRSIIGEDWRGVWRGGGAILEMDFDGNEQFQLWRYWEDEFSETTLPKIEGEIENYPGKGRLERITHDEFKYFSTVISRSNKYMLFTCNKENKRDMLVYMTRLSDSNTGAEANSRPFTLEARQIVKSTSEGTARWHAYGFSLDDKYILLARMNSSADKPLYIVDISGDEPTLPELITLPGSQPGASAVIGPAFSFDPEKPHVVYLISNAFGDFDSVVSYDIATKSVTHITTSEKGLSALRPIPWEADMIHTTQKAVLFTVNFEGWNKMYALPLVGPHQGEVVELRLGWEQGWIAFGPNSLNNKPGEVVLHLASYRSKPFLVRIDIDDVLENGVRADPEDGENKYAEPRMRPYSQAAPPVDETAVPPKLLKLKSFDGLEIPCMYYRPKGVTSAVPVVISIHGGPESQSTSQSRTATHGYLINDLKCAVIYPNVRGSSGYGKKYMAADDVEKREDSVKDIGALLDHIHHKMQNELDSSRIAVMGGSYGGYMVFATLTHYSSCLTCGIAHFGITHWPSFLQNTAPVRRAHRRAEYGDETNPEIRTFLERISPINNADKISVPMLITHGETDTRVTIHEAFQMYGVVSKKVHTELVVCEKEGHGYKQKSVIEFVNAAVVQFVERHLLSRKTNL